MPSASPAQKDPKLSAALKAQAQSLVQEGLLIRWAGLQRRYALQGPLDFSKPTPEVPSVKSFKDLVPKYLKNVPQDWVVTSDGYERQIPKSQGPALSRLINADKDDLGVYRCEKRPEGYALVVEF